MIIVYVINFCWRTLWMDANFKFHEVYEVYEVIIFVKNISVCILYTDFCSWIIILVESASLGAQNDIVS